MKLYVVVYGDVSPDIILRENLKKSAEYVGTDYNEAEITYKRLTRWSVDRAHFYEIDLAGDKLTSHTAGESLSKDLKANKVLREYENFIYGSSLSIIRRMVKNGKVSISFQSLPETEESMNTSYRTVRYRWNKFTDDPKDIYKAVKMATDYFVAKNNVTVPLKLTMNGKTFAAYNQK